jgi:hypothetical protein
MLGTAWLRAAALWLIPIVAACSPGDPGPAGPNGEPECLVASLVPGEDVMFEGSAAVDCIEIPAFEPGDQYELVVSTMARSLGFSPMDLRLTPVDATVIAGSRSQVPGVQVLPSSGESDVDLAWRRGQYAMDAQLRLMEGPLLPQIRSTASRVGAGLFAVPVVGEEITYGFSCVSAQKFPNAPRVVKGKVRYVSERAVIVEGLEVSSGFTIREYAEIAAAFDDVIYNTDVSYFGEPGDIDQNGGRIVLLYTSGVNRMSDDYTDSFIAGFTCPVDLGASGGNRAEMFYLMVPDPDGEFTAAEGDGVTKVQVRRTTDNTVAHELQHLINAQSGNGGAQDVWLNEGLSHLAEEVVGHAVNGFVPGTSLGSEQLLATQTRIDVFNKFYLNNWFNLSQYLSAPGDTAALLNASDPLDYNTFRMRGAAWSFLRYLLDRYEDGSAGEAARVRELIQTSSSDSRDAITQVFGEPFDRLATQWSTMLVSSDRNDVDPSLELQLSSYQVREVFGSRIGEAVNPPTGGYPLRPHRSSLNLGDVIDAELFSATSMYVGLVAPVAGAGTRIKLVSPGTGAMLHSSVEPRLQILRIH